MPRVAKLLKGMAKRQKQDEMWDSLGRTTNLNPMATCLQFSYATNLSLLFAGFHAKIIPWGYDSQDFVQLGFSGGEEDDNDEEDDAFLGF